MNRALPVKEKNEIKKLVFTNLVNIFGKNIIFCGSLCDWLYADLSFDLVKDIDIIVPYSYKNIFFHKLLYDFFYVRQEDKKNPYRLQTYRMHEPIINIHLSPTPYSDCCYKSFKYMYSITVFGINIDIFFIANNDNIKLIFNNLWNNAENTYTSNCLPYQINGIYFESKHNRICKLNHYISQNIVADKHKSRLNLYESSLNNKINLDKLNLINEYIMPKSFSYKKYLSYNKDLHVLKYKDGLISHYLSHGLHENRRYKD